MRCQNDELTALRRPKEHANCIFHSHSTCLLARCTAKPLLRILFGTGELEGELVGVNEAVGEVVLIHEPVRVDVGVDVSVGDGIAKQTQREPRCCLVDKPVGGVGWTHSQDTFNTALEIPSKYLTSML
eukprot:gb/GECG01000311.1/.p1 GENE.gb/GECG01000311.1/~~gb/GECG01000311.1/.p1  ORF type:complete len:128 (+),score=4.36 gb/GECG01000311.1/:1-384(+)